MKYLLGLLLVVNSFAFSATVWVDQSGLFKQQKSATGSVQYLKLTDQQIKDYASTIVIAPVESWIQCATEGATCTFLGTHTVRFGANGVYAKGIYKDSVLCDNSIFGDPIANVAKSCQVSSLIAVLPIVTAPVVAPMPAPVVIAPVVVAPAPMPMPMPIVVAPAPVVVAPTNPIIVNPILPTVPVWTKCSDENGKCVFVGTSRQVRFGSSVVNTFTTKQFSDSVYCTGDGFGGDPASGVAKYCEMSSDYKVTIDMANVAVIDNSKLPPHGYNNTALRIRATTNLPVPNTGTTNGDFRISCPLSHMMYDDPIVKPNQAGTSHLHQFFGNGGTNASSTSASLMVSGGSSCDGGTMNSTAYWTPAVIDTATGAPVSPSGSNEYYKTGDSNNVVAVPTGLIMLAGDGRYSSAQDYMHWVCLDKNDNVVVAPTAYIPSCPAGVGNKVKIFLIFPEYWDGINLDTPNHRTHMSYVKDATHPVTLPTVTFNVAYDVPVGADTTKWRLSSDMYDKALPGGMSLHGDYMFGWTVDPVSGKNFSQIFTDNCLKKALNCGDNFLGDGREFQY